MPGLPGFPTERRITRRLFVDMPPGQLPKSPASSSLYDASPHTFIRSPHLWLGEFVISNAKRLFRQHRPGTAINGQQVYQIDAPHIPSDNSLTLAVVGIPDSLCVANASAKPSSGGRVLACGLFTFGNRRRRRLAFILQSTNRTRSRQSDCPRRSFEFGANRTSAARGSECGHPHVRRSSAARRSLLCNLLRKFALDQATLRTSAM
jgi:hypothetical protein